jgi:uncharacterized repeat protein (TIGR01451 family)
MKLKHITYAAAGVLMLGSQAALAAGTDANSDILNFATVDFQVATVPQPTTTSNTVTFEVDRRIILTVAEVGAADTTVAPGSSNQVLAFDVTNTTNDTIDILLTTTQQVGGAGPRGDTDDYNANNVRIYRDDPVGSAPGAFDGADFLVTALDNVAEDATVRVFVVSDIPASPTAVDGSNATINLTGQAADATTGAAFTQTAGADTEDGTNNDNADNVFADVAGDGDAARDGMHSDDDSYAVSAATVSVTKTSIVVSDPLNLAVNPKRIPGAVVEYCIVVQNTGSSAADTVVVTDSIAGDPVTFVTGSIIAGGTDCTTGGTSEDDDAAGGDDTLSATENTGNFAGSAVTTTVFTVPSGSSTVTRFQVTIN